MMRFDAAVAAAGADEDGMGMAEQWMEWIPGMLG
jgi:hypothetical protein